MSSSTSRNALEKTMFTDTKRLENECASKLQAGATLDEVITYLHAQDISILDAIKIIRYVGCLSLGDAKRIVSCHSVWQPIVQSNQALHDEAEAAGQASEREH
jgi:hypothetical protein